MRGMRMTIIPVPVHRLKLTCGLVSGEVKIGVHPALPVEGVDVILGNDLAGTNVWADRVPPLVITQVPVLLPQKAEVKQKAKGEPDIDLLPACTVTRAMSREKNEAAQQSKTETKVILPLLLKTITKIELIQAQKSNPSLKALFESVLPTADMEAAVRLFCAG